jgi:hypothetical protein
MPRLSHADGTGMTGVHKRLLAPLSPLFVLSLLAGAPLAIPGFLPPYDVRGALNRLHELVSRSYWVHISSLLVDLVVF